MNQYLMLIGQTALFSIVLGDTWTCANDESKTYADVGKCLVENRADVLLITSEELKDAWNNFSNWKTRTGRPAKIVTVEEIKDSYSGRDVQAKIRSCCLDHIEHQNTKWVILGGDSKGRSGHVPDRDTHHAEFFKYKNLPTDIYYLSQRDWDTNDDGIYGKFADDMDDVDYTHPQATIGRIPVRTAQDVKDYTTKVIDYESEYPLGDFAKQMVYTCAVEHANPKLNTSKSDVRAQWTESQIQQFFVDHTPWDKEDAGDHDLVAENWLSMINEGNYGKIHMHGHGLNQLWVLENDSLVTKETVEQLTNEHAYPVMTTVSCFTGQFDSFRDPCITESMLRKSSAGAIAIIAPSREGIPVFHERSDFAKMMTEGKMDGTTETLTRFWQHALNENLTLGEALRSAKNDMETHARKTDGYHFVQCELNLLGDPTLDIRARAVTPIESKAQLKESKLVVSGVKDCGVCVWDGADFYQVVATSSVDTVSIDLSTAKNATVKVAAFGPSKNTWTAQIKTQK